MCDEIIVAKVLCMKRTLAVFLELYCRREYA